LGNENLFKDFFLEIGFSLAVGAVDFMLCLPPAKTTSPFLAEIGKKI
jgi:hypothetical protein